MPDLTTPTTTNPSTPTQSPMMYTPPPQPTCGQGTPPPNVEDAIQTSERYFVSLRKEAYRAVKTQEAEHLTLPWGPRIDVVFDPKGAPGLLNGRVRLMGRTRGAREFELASMTITNADAPITLSASFACDEYVVKASAGSDPGLSVRIPESYFFARVYDARR